MPEATATRFNYWFIPFTGMSSIAEMKHGGDTVRCFSLDRPVTDEDRSQMEQLGLLLAAPPNFGFPASFSQWSKS